jgi:hypothetical protein
MDRRNNISEEDILLNLLRRRMETLKLVSTKLHGVISQTTAIPISHVKISFTDPVNKFCFVKLTLSHQLNEMIADYEVLCGVRWFKPTFWDYL